MHTFIHTYIALQFQTGMKVGFPLTQTCVVFNALWGIFYFKEIDLFDKKSKNFIRFSCGLAAVVLGSFFLADSAAWIVNVEYFLYTSGNDSLALLSCRYNSNFLIPQRKDEIFFFKFIFCTLMYTRTLTWWGNSSAKILIHRVNPFGNIRLCYKYNN